MAATKAEHVIQFPTTPAAAGADRTIQLPGTPAATKGGQERTAPKEPVGCCCRSVVCLIFAAFAACYITFLVLLAKESKLDPPAVYTAAVAGLPGLDAAVPPTVVAFTGDGTSSLPVVPALFNLTVSIHNPSQLNVACVANSSMAVVSYGGAPVAAGAVPAFCAGKTEEHEVVVPVWGLGADVPSALRTRDAAVVDVAIRMPPCGRYEMLLLCSAKVGEGLSLCEWTTMIPYHRCM